jgi:hypothetical protein
MIKFDARIVLLKYYKIMDLIDHHFRIHYGDCGLIELIGANLYCEFYDVLEKVKNELDHRYSIEYYLGEEEIMTPQIHYDTEDLG